MAVLRTKYVPYKRIFFSDPGGLGQLGTGLARHLRSEFGQENVILSDIVRPDKEILDNGTKNFQPLFSTIYKL